MDHKQQCVTWTLEHEPGRLVTLCQKCEDRARGLCQVSEGRHQAWCEGCEARARGDAGFLCGLVAS